MALRPCGVAVQLVLCGLASLASSGSIHRSRQLRLEGVRGKVQGMEASPVLANLTQTLSSALEQRDTWELDCMIQAEASERLRSLAAKRLAAADNTMGQISQVIVKNQAKQQELMLKLSAITDRRAEHIKMCKRTRAAHGPASDNLNHSHDLTNDAMKAIGHISPEVAAHLAKVSGSLRDQALRAGERDEQNREHCKTQLATMREQQEMFEETKRIVVVRLSNLLLEKAEAEEIQKNASLDVQGLRGMQKEKKARCKDDIDSIESRIHNLRQQRMQILATLGKNTLIADCQVSKWRTASSCSKQCNGGVQNLTREIVHIQETEGMPCPKLHATVPCNEEPCPRDCSVSSWTEWSQCSASCGGGRRQRQRQVLMRARGTGRPCSATSDVEGCNVQSCEPACTFSDWGPWGICTKACGGGTRGRRRMAEAALDEGQCPADEIVFQPCHELA